MATKKFNTRQVMAGFGVSDMTIFTWRQGTATRDPLPHNTDEAGRVTFTEAEMKRWAKKYSLTFDSAKAEAVTGPKKAGPVVPPPKAAKKAAARAAA